MKLDASMVDITSEEITTINTPDNFKKKILLADQIQSHEIPIVIKYDYLDLGNTQYNFFQKFEQKDTQMYFQRMKEISSNTINQLKNRSSEDRKFHFYRSNIQGNLRDAIRKHISTDYADDLIIYHFGLYESDSKNASRQSGERSPRIYFMLGTYGSIYPVFFDPYHELNPIVLEPKKISKPNKKHTVKGKIPKRK